MERETRTALRSRRNRLSSPAIIGTIIGWREELKRSENQSFWINFGIFKILSKLQLHVDAAVLVDDDPVDELLAGALPLHVVHLRPGRLQGAEDALDLLLFPLDGGIALLLADLRLDVPDALPGVEDLFAEHVVGLVLVLEVVETAQALSRCGQLLLQHGDVVDAVFRLPRVGLPQVFQPEQLVDDGLLHVLAPEALAVAAVGLAEAGVAGLADSWRPFG